MYIFQALGGVAVTWLSRAALSASEMELTGIPGRLSGGGGISRGDPSWFTLSCEDALLGSLGDQLAAQVSFPLGSKPKGRQVRGSVGTGPGRGELESWDQPDLGVP